MAGNGLWDSSSNSLAFALMPPCWVHLSTSRYIPNDFTPTPCSKVVEKQVAKDSFLVPKAPIGFLGGTVQACEQVERR